MQSQNRLLDDLAKMAQVETRTQKGPILSL